MRPKLGALLVQEGLCTREQIEKALQMQVFHGGRLGSILVELGFLAPEQLAEGLAKLHGVPLVTPELLEALLPAMPRVLKLEQIAELEALPLRVDGRTLHVAVVDPGNFTHLDALRFATGLRPKLYLAPEALFWAYAEAYLGLTKPERMIELRREPKAAEWRVKREEEARDKLSGLEIPEELRSASSLYAPGEGLTAGDDLSAGLDEEGRMPPRRAPAEPLVEEEVLELLEEAEAPPLPGAIPPPKDALRPAPPPPAAEALSDFLTNHPRPTAPRPQTFTLDEAIAACVVAPSRDEVTEALKRYARGVGARIVLFYVRDATAIAYAGDGPGVDPATLPLLRIPLASPSPLSTAFSAKLPFLGAPPPGAGSEALAEALGGEPAECFVLAAKVAGRVLHLLYFDADPLGVPEELRLQALRLGGALEATWQRLLLQARAGAGLT